MNNTLRVGIVCALAIAVAVVLVLKKDNDSAGQDWSSTGLPCLVDLGAGKCVACKMLAPVLEELRKECAGRLQVVYIDVRKNPEASEKYGIKLIPTLIFYDASGEELHRHEGFLSKRQILARWKSFGVDLGPAKGPAIKIGGP
jgi:thioredoxin 1